MFSGGWFSSLDVATTTFAPKGLREDSIIFRDSHDTGHGLRRCLVKENSSGLDDKTRKSALFKGPVEVDN